MVGREKYRVLATDEQFLPIEALRAGDVAEFVDVSRVALAGIFRDRAGVEKDSACGLWTGSRVLYVASVHQDALVDVRREARRVATSGSSSVDGTALVLPFVYAAIKSNAV